MRGALSLLTVGCVAALAVGAAVPAGASARIHRSAGASATSPAPAGASAAIRPLGPAAGVAAPGATAATVRPNFSIVGILGGLCSLAGNAPGPVGVVGKVCSGVQKGGSALSTGAKLLGGGGGSVVRTALTAAGLAAIGLWAAHGAQAALREAAHVIGAVTNPQLKSTWFSTTYWRVAGLAALLTVPFLFAAAIQALVRTDLTLLVRAAFGYLPLAMLAVGIAAPVTMLLLAASDQMSGTVSATAGDGGGKFLTLLGGSVASLSGFGGSTFFMLVLGVVIVGAATALTLELLLREAAVYVVVLMLPLAFAAMVWPARRVWAVRIVELLIALILSKFVIVSVLTLAEGALGQLGGDGVGTVLAGMTLLLLATFSPWVLLKLIPFAELGAGVGGALSGERDRFARFASRADVLDSLPARSDAEITETAFPALPEGQPQVPADDGHGHPGFGPGLGGPGGGAPGGGAPGGGGPGGGAPQPAGAPEAGGGEAVAGGEDAEPPVRGGGGGDPVRGPAPGGPTGAGGAIPGPPAGDLPDPGRTGYGGTADTGPRTGQESTAQAAARAGTGVRQQPVGAAKAELIRNIEARTGGAGQPLTLDEIPIDLPALSPPADPGAGDPVPRVDSPRPAMQAETPAPSGPAAAPEPGRPPGAPALSRPANAPEPAIREDADPLPPPQPADGGVL